MEIEGLTKEEVVGNSIVAGTSIIDAKVNRNVWLVDLVPIISDGKNHTAYITDNIDVPSEYNKLIHFLGMLDSEDNITIVINNGGGYINSAWMIIEAIINCKATTTASISGTVASAATIIALSCNKLKVARFTEWLSHNYSGGVSGKGNEIKAQSEFMTRELKVAFTEIHRGFFSKKEISELIDDKDYWLNKEQIEDRWKSMKKYKAKGK